jgi:GNAT superfamily N-acetyltransferase
VDRFLSSIEVRFRGSGLEPTILIGAKCTRSLGVLRRAGYRVVDSMSVLELGRPSFNTNDSIAVRAVKSSSQQDWSRAYLQSFYGDTKLLPHVKRIVKRLSGLRDVVLLEAALRGRTAGVLAVQRSKGLAGVYCVGTLPRFRRMGVAGTLITAAGRIAEEEGRRLILQTLESDRAETFYLRGGFRKLYAKKVLSRGLKT